MAANVDVYRAFVVVFIDAPNKRAGATGGHFNVGIDNGGFLYEYQTYASGQIAFDFSNAQTIAHETGHNIGFADLYNNSDGSYHPGLLFPRNWDVMDTQNQFPHTGLWHKEITAGWLTAAGAGVGRLDAPAALGAVTTANFVLTPLEFGSAEYDALLAGAPPGRAVVKAIRLGLSAAADDHYMLLSNRRHGTAFSQTLPQRAGAATRGGIYVTDAISTRSFDFFRPSTRNFEHPLSDPAPIAGDANPVVDNNPSPDLNLLATYPAYDGISVDIVGEIPGPGALNDRPSYLVDIRREQKDFLDLRITPWGAPPYESPDIWIEQAQNALSAAPLPGNGEPARWSADYDQAANGGIPLNFIRVKVTNSGTVPATAVQVRVKVNTPGGMGDDGTWVSLPLSDAKDVPAGGSAIFDLPWNPRVNRHTCILAEVYRWTSDLGDLEPWNNATQENVNSFHPTAASPWETMPVEFEVANGFATPIEVAIEPENLPPGYILALNESFLSIPGRSKTLVTGTLRMDENIIPPMTAAQARKQRPATFHVAAYVMGGDYRIFAGGITYQVFPSVRTEVSVQVGMTTAGEIAVTGSTSPPADNTRVTVVLRYPSGRYQWVDATTDANGGISVTIPPLEQGNVRVLVEVPPGDGFAPVTTGPFMVATSEPPGARQGVAGSDYTGFYLGGLFMEDTLQLRSGLHTGFRYGRFFRQRFSAEIETGIMPTSRAGVSGLFGNAQANIRFHPLPPSTPARVFALIGAGVGWFRGVGASDASLVYTVGVGADFRWTPSVGFRLDARDYMPADLFTSGVTHNLQINWATIFHF